MIKLCSTGYPGHRVNIDVLMQIVFSVIGIVPVYENPREPNVIEFYATAPQELEIQECVNKHYPAVSHLGGSELMEYLFRNRLYVFKTILITEEVHRGCPATCKSLECKFHP